MDEAVPPGKDDRRLWYKVYVERDGVSRKGVSFSKKSIQTMGTFAAFAVNLRSIQELKRAVSFMDKAIDGLIAITSPVCLNKWL